MTVTQLRGTTTQLRDVTHNMSARPFSRSLRPSAMMQVDLPEPVGIAITASILGKKLPGTAGGRPPGRSACEDSSP